MTTRSVAALAALCTAFSLAACGGDTKSEPGTGDTLVIGIKFDQPGIALKKGSEYEGFDVEVAKYIAKELGKEGKVEFKEAPTPQRETLIETGQVDFIVATYSITDKRKEKVSFAGPYYIAAQDLLVRSNEKDITGFDKLDGKKLCSVKGSTSATSVKEKFPKVQLQEYDTYSKCVEALNAGMVDALTTDDTILAGYAAQEQYRGKLKVVGNPLAGKQEKYGVGLKKGATEFCTKVTTALNSMMSSGEWKKAVDTYLAPAGLTIDPAVNPPKPAVCS